MLPSSSCASAFRPVPRKAAPSLDAASHAAASGWDGIWVADNFMPSSEPLDSRCSSAGRCSLGWPRAFHAYASARW